MSDVLPFDWLDPWEEIAVGGVGLVAKLERKLSQEHVLFGRGAKAVGRRVDFDDVLFQQEDGSFASFI